MWTRRAFLEMTGAAAAAVGLGALGISATLKGRVYFEENRALPGMRVALTLDVDNPTDKTVSLLARVDGTERIIGKMRGSSCLEVEIPMIETESDSYELKAIVEDGERCCMSEPIEVLSEPFTFGL